MPEAVTENAEQQNSEEAVVNAALADSKTVPPTLTVTRGKSDTTPGITWKFVQAKLKKKNKIDNDKFALVPEKPTPETFEKWLQFLETPNAALLSYQRARGMSANWTTSAINKAGEFSVTDFIKCVEEMSARGETIKALIDERAELTNEIISLSQDTKMSPVDKVKRVTEIGARLNTINETIAFRQAENKEDAEVESAADSNTSEQPVQAAA